MCNNPLFSVLIANYNNGLYLMEAINSVYAQDYNNWEIVIVDDASSDNSREIYESLKSDSRIRIFYNNQNKGCGFTKRRCVDESLGEICGFLDPDDTLTIDAIGQMVNCHHENNNLSLVHSKFIFCDDMLTPGSIYSHGEDVTSNKVDFFNLSGEIVHFVSFKKQFYDKTDGLDTFLLRAVDQDLYLKLYDVGETYFLDKVLYNYRIHKGGISVNNNARKAYYWRWVVIMSTIRRRNLLFEDSFFDYFVPRNEYDYLLKKYQRFMYIDKYIDKIKRIFKKLKRLFIYGL